MSTLSALFTFKEAAEAAQLRLHEIGLPGEAIEIIDQENPGTGLPHLWTSIKRSVRADKPTLDARYVLMAAVPEEQVNLAKRICEDFEATVVRI